MTRLIILVALVASCLANPPPGQVYSADPKGELTDPTVRAIVINRAARDLACDPGVVTVVAFALPKSTIVDGKTVEYTSVGLAVVEGNGQRITYAVMPAKLNDVSGWALVDDDLVMVAHIPIIASAPPLTPVTGSDADAGSDAGSD